jgi:hypothetical protein
MWIYVEEEPVEPAARSTFPASNRVVAVQPRGVLARKYRKENAYEDNS